MMSWPKSRYGSLHLHGHIHSKGDYNIKQRDAGILRYDVGIDANNYQPVSLGGSMTISGQQYPRELVKSRFLKLNM